METVEYQKPSIDIRKKLRVFEKTENVPIILLGNELPHSYRNEDSFSSRVCEMHFFSDCSFPEPGRLASLLLCYCVEYCALTSKAALSDLGYFSLSKSDLALLSDRTGAPYLFPPGSSAESYFSNYHDGKANGS